MPLLNIQQIKSSGPCWGIPLNPYYRLTLTDIILHFDVLMTISKFEVGEELEDNVPQWTKQKQKWNLHPYSVFCFICHRVQS